jgi:hypothetical protein
MHALLHRARRVGTTPAQVAEQFKVNKQAFAEAVRIMGLKPE